MNNVKINNALVFCAEFSLFAIEGFQGFYNDFYLLIYTVFFNKKFDLNTLLHFVNPTEKVLFLF